MRRVSTIAAAMALVAVTVLGCGQVPAAGTSSAPGYRDRANQS